MKAIATACLSVAALAAVSSVALAGAAPEEAIAMLQKRGYSAIQIIPDETPGYEANACKGGTRFGITLDPQSNIIDVDPRGACNATAQEYVAAPPPQESAEGFKGEYHGGVETGPVVADAAVFDQLHRRGYYDIRVIDRDDDEIEVLACKDERLYELEVKYDGRIDDIDRKGRCGPRRQAGNDGVVVDAPFAGVRVGRGNVHIRAPFVDLKIPR